MTRYNVVPQADSNRWKVRKNGRFISRHNTQANAAQRARREASSGDQLVIHGRNGQIREQRTVR